MPATLRVVIAKADRLYGELISRQIKEHWPGAEAFVFQKGFDALESIQQAAPDLFIAGTCLDDMDGLEHLEPFIERSLPILIVTSRRDFRTLTLLREVRYNGLFDGNAEGLLKLHVAIERIFERELYVSGSFLPHIKKPKKLTLDDLTPREEEVLSVIGDGADDKEASQRLGISPSTVNTHRKAIMTKLRLHHKGEIIRYAIQSGYVRITSRGVARPGFQRRLYQEGNM